ncbi:MAG: acyltransferase family protein [Deinococcus sp.]
MTALSRHSEVAATPGSGLHGPRPHLAALTGVRFAAALLVVCLHTRASLAGVLPHPLMELIRAGQVGVTLFFILSGFILTYTYLRPGSPQELSTPRRDFWAARFARIYPVYALGLLVSLPFLLEPLLHRLPSKTEAASLLLAPLLLQAWLPQTACVWNCPGWSLSTEGFFYLLFPLVLGGVAWLRRRGVLAGGLLLWLLALLPPLLYLRFSPRPFPPESLLMDAAYYGPAFRLPEFLLGMLLGQEFLRRPSSPRAAALLTLLGLAGTLLLMVYSGAVTVPPLRNALVIPFMAALIWGLAHGRGMVARLLAWRPMIALGEASYSLYILHVPVYLWLDWARRHFSQTTSAPGFRFFLVYLGVLVLLSLATYAWVERPAQRAVLRAWRRRTARASASAGVG